MLRAMLLATLVVGVFADNPFNPQDILNGMEAMMTSRGAKFEDFERLDSCLSSLSTELKATHDKMWSGFVELYLQEDNGWNRECDGVHHSGWNESDKTIMTVQHSNGVDEVDIVICEPCNFASNVAYYWIATRICANPELKAFSHEESLFFAKTAALLSVGSGFMHGSNTGVGSWLDTRYDSLYPLGVYQSIINYLPDAYRNDPVVFDINPTARGRTAVQVNEEVGRIIDAYPVEEWLDQLSTLNDDIPDVTYPIGGWIVTLLYLSLPETMVQSVADFIMNFLDHDGSAVDHAGLMFLNETYIPKIREITAQVDWGFLPIVKKTAFASRALGSMLKLAFGAMFQEQLVIADFVLDPAANEKAAALFPSLNSFADSLTGFPDPDYLASAADNVYPGAPSCRPNIAHAKWHEATAGGFFDMYLMADEVASLFKTIPAPSEVVAVV